MNFDWKPGSSEGLVAGDEGAVAFARKQGEEGYLADLWIYQDTYHLDMSLLQDGVVTTDRVQITKLALGGNKPEEWADAQFKQFLNNNNFDTEES